MARGGINLAVVRKARDALVARGQYPSIDAVRVELGNTGSKTTIQRYLKEIESFDPRPTASPSRLSDELTACVETMLGRLLEEGNEALAHERQAFEQERTKMGEGVAALQEQLGNAKEEIARLQQALESQSETLGTTQSTLQTEITRNARISQSCTDLEVRIQEKDEQIRSLEDKHQHAREALEHYRTAVKEQREQEQRRHESQLQQIQQELSQVQQSLMVKHDELTRLSRDNERLLSESRQHAKDASKERDSVERLRADVGIANGQTARAEGAKELLQQQLNAATSEAVEMRSVIAALQGEEKRLAQQLDQTLAELEALRISATEDPHVVSNNQSQPDS
ncbi:integrase [Pseudomonas putida]|uniref:Integrase n=1 Tax=Pseudomonas putida TaxID=303 RepID=A0A1Y3KAL8_PSEPU|nr:DNA-binding protein [Pseudomonas putida]OUM22685.1 integrase [Pseudomonas putida]